MTKKGTSKSSHELDKDLHEILDIVEAVDKSQSTYFVRLTTIVRRLFRTEDLSGFDSAMTSAVEQNINDGWFAGMKDCGFDREEINAEEQRALQSLIDTSLSAIGGFGEDIVEGKQNDKTPNDFSQRVFMWANRWNEAFVQAQSMTCSDRKMEWVLGVTDHCTDCLNYAGRVYRASTWKRWGIHPQSNRLFCRGFNCQCFFRETDGRATPGRPPNPSF